ncbi:transposase-like protein, IS1381 ISSpn7 [Streptococcus pneumoniae]|nr:transposase-like protein, IS1381 ISSpn7 [Streptococcus pneumoniae]
MVFRNEKYRTNGKNLGRQWLSRAHEDIPQAQPPRKFSKLKPLTVEDKAYNHALSKERRNVENILAKVKTFKMFSTTYRNHRKRFGLRMNLIAGIINHELGF